MKRTPQHIVDEWLVVSAQAGDKAAFARLLQRWSPKLLGYAASQLRDMPLAQDVTQEVLLVITNGIATLKDPGAFPKWAYQILQRCCIDAVRKRQTQQRLTMNTTKDEEMQTAQDCMLNTLSVNAALNSLTPELTQVVRLFYLEGFSVTEIADIAEIPVGTVKSRLFSARQQLKTYLEDNEDGKS